MARIENYDSFECSMLIRCGWWQKRSSGVAVRTSDFFFSSFRWLYAKWDDTIWLSDFQFYTYLFRVLFIGCALVRFVSILEKMGVPRALHLHLKRAHKVNIGKYIILINLIEQIESEQRKISDLSKCSKIRRKKASANNSTPTRFRWIDIDQSTIGLINSQMVHNREHSSFDENQLKKKKRHRKFPLWCKYFHISVCIRCCVCTLTYWHINCNQVRSVSFVSFFFCCCSALFFPFVWALRFFFLCRIVLRFQY